MNYDQLLLISNILLIVAMIKMIYFFIKFKNEKRLDFTTKAPVAGVLALTFGRAFYFIGRSLSGMITQLF